VWSVNLARFKAQVAGSADFFFFFENPLTPGGPTSSGSVAAKIGSPLESDLSLYFLQIQKSPTDLFEGFPGNT
jgi:hypothetical protein